MMTRFVRWTHELVAQVDTLIAQVENHDAIAGSSIRHMDRSVARAAHHLTRVERQGRELATRLEEERTAEARWRDRARREPDDDRAVECLRRARQSLGAAKRLEERLAEHRDMEASLRRDVRTLEEQVRRVRDQRMALRSREARSEATRAVVGVEPEGIEDIFDRWELHLAMTEVPPNSDHEHEAFESDFERAEEDAELRDELAALRSEVRS